MTFDKKWEEFSTANNGNNYPETPLVRFIARNFYNLKDRKNIRILDMGCGSGASVCFLAAEGFSVYGIDGSKSAINISKKRLENKNLEAELLLGDFQTLPFEDHFFNCVIDIASLQHNDNNSIKSALSEVYRILNPNGKYFVMLIKSSKDLSDKNFYTNYLDDNSIKKLFYQFDIIDANVLKYTENN